VSDVAPLGTADETFVYTGGAPVAIQIVELVLAPAKRGYRGGTPSGPRRTSESVRSAAAMTPDATRDDSSFLGTPRAY
jgi:hypothetical protein